MDLGENSYEVFTFLSKDFQKHLKFIVRWLREELDMIQLKDTNPIIYSMGRAKWPFLPKWMKTLGFLPLQLIEGAGRYGEDYILYRRK